MQILKNKNLTSLFNNYAMGPTPMGGRSRWRKHGRWARRRNWKLGRRTCGGKRMSQVSYRIRSWCPWYADNVGIHFGSFFWQPRWPGTQRTRQRAKVDGTWQRTWKRTRPWTGQRGTRGESERWFQQRRSGRRFSVFIRRGRKAGQTDVLYMLVGGRWWRRSNRKWIKRTRSRTSRYRTWRRRQIRKRRTATHSESSSAHSTPSLKTKEQMKKPRTPTSKRETRTSSTTPLMSPEKFANPLMANLQRPGGPPLPGPNGPYPPEWDCLVNPSRGCRSREPLVLCRCITV